MSTFGTLRAANVARQAEWDTGGNITLTFRATEMAGEVGEACNVIKKLERERLGIQGSRATVQDLADELADVVICADLIAMGEEIDLDAAVAAKFNATSVKVGLATRLLPGGSPVAPKSAQPEVLLSQAWLDVGHERRRQVLVEGWSPEDDDLNRGKGELAAAAATYAIASTYEWRAFETEAGNMAFVDPPSCWPWAAAWWKPKDRRRDLVRAAALLIAEIERLDRAAVKP